MFKGVQFERLENPTGPTAWKLSDSEIRDLKNTRRWRKRRHMPGFVTITRVTGTRFLFGRWKFDDFLFSHP